MRNQSKLFEAFYEFTREHLKSDDWKNNHSPMLQISILRKFLTDILKEESTDWLEAFDNLYELYIKSDKYPAKIVGEFPIDLFSVWLRTGDFDRALYDDLSIRLGRGCTDSVFMQNDANSYCVDRFGSMTDQISRRVHPTASSPRKTLPKTP